MGHRFLDRGLVARALPALLAPAHHDQQRVVDRDAESDERDQVLDRDRDIGDVRQRPDQQERRRDRNSRHQQRHEGRQRAEHEGEHDQRTRTRDQHLGEGAHARVAVAAGGVGAQGLEARHPDRRPGDRDPVERRSGPTGLRLADLERGPFRNQDERIGRAAVAGHERRITRRCVRGDARPRQRLLHLREGGVELRSNPGRVDRRLFRQRHHRHDRRHVSPVAEERRDLAVRLEPLPARHGELLRERVPRGLERGDRGNCDEDPDARHQPSVGEDPPG